MPSSWINGGYYLFEQAVLDLQRSQQILQVSQAVGSRLIQSSLLDFLR